MIQVKIHGVEQFRARQILYMQGVRDAVAKGLSKTAYSVRKAQVHEMGDVFDRPTPYVLNSVRVEEATIDNLTAKVYIEKSPNKGMAPEKILNSEVFGGSRRMKRFEKALQAVGAMPPGYRAVPGSAAQIDQYGNINPGQIVQILSWFKAFPEMGYKANMSAKRRASLQKGNKKKNIRGFAYFAGRPGGRLPDGIWQRFSSASGSSIKPVLIFVRHANYQAIYDFKYVAQKVAERELQNKITAAINKALRDGR